MKNQQNNDTASLKEVISRRLKHSEWELPDLIILDGGAPQVSAILPLLKDLKIPVIGRDKSGDHSKSAPVKIIVPVKKRRKSAPKAPEFVESAESEVSLSAQEFTQKPSNPEYLDNSEKPYFKTVRFAPSSHVARLIARIDEEAHRFAITYHTLLKRKRLLGR